MDGSVQLQAPVALLSGKSRQHLLDTRLGWHQICAEENDLMSGAELCFIHLLAVTYSLCSDLHVKCVAVVVHFMAALLFISSSYF